MNIYITSDKGDRAADLREVVLKLKALPFPVKIFLVCKGAYSWELALGLGVTGVLTRKDNLGDAVLSHLRLVRDDEKNL